MGAKDEAEKAAVRKQSLSPEEADLEGARERFHADRKNKAARAEFREAQHAVARARLEARILRHHEPPPAGANVTIASDGRAAGWELDGNAVIAVGGRDL